MTDMFSTFSEQQLVYLRVAATVFTLIIVVWKFRRPSIYDLDQKALTDYLSSSLDSTEVGTLYERYLGYLAAQSGYFVNYNGAVNTYRDFGRDLILEKKGETVLVQAKCWAGFKTIHESHIFQLYGSLVHFTKTQKAETGTVVKAMFCTSAKYSDVAIKAAKVLGIELKEENLSRDFPMVKCIVLDDGTKSYVLPFDNGYDELSIDFSRGEEFVYTVQEALEKGFDRLDGFRAA